MTDRPGVDTGLAKCPHCSGTSGYFRKTRVAGMTRTNYRLDGSESDNCEIHDPLAYTEQVTMYCQDCEQPIGKAKLN